jgi:hypothetical protein
MSKQFWLSQRASQQAIEPAETETSAEPLVSATRQPYDKVKTATYITTSVLELSAVIVGAGYVFGWWS